MDLNEAKAMSILKPMSILVGSQFNFNSIPNGL
jgi:hypothetical protein